MFGPLSTDKNWTYSHSTHLTQLHPRMLVVHTKVHWLHISRLIDCKTFLSSLIDMEQPSPLIYFVKISSLLLSNMLICYRLIWCQEHHLDACHGKAEQLLYMLSSRLPWWHQDTHESFRKSRKRHGSIVKCCRRCLGTGLWVYVLLREYVVITRLEESFADCFYHT